MSCRFMNQCIVRNFKQFMEKYKIAVYIIIGLILYIPRYLFLIKVLPNNDFVVNIIEIATIVGSTLLASGVFTSIVKSLLFKDIYASVLADIIFGEKYLMGRSTSELQEIWKRVTSALYNNDFPDLNKKIQSHVLNVYLPSGHDYYYKNCRHVITYTENKLLPNHVDVEEEICATVVGIEPNAIYKFGASFYIDEEVPDMKNYIVEEFKVDGILVNKKEIKETDKEDQGKKENDVKREAVLEVISKEIEGTPKAVSVRCNFSFNAPKATCEIRRKTKCTYPLIALNKIKIVNFKRFVDGLIVIIKYPEEQYVIDFATLGSLKDFENRCEEKQGILCKEHNDIIFPNQGFLIYLDKK